MNENIMENNEVLEAAEDMVPNGSGVGLKLAGGALILGGAIYGGIKLFKKIKAKRAEKAEAEIASHTECNECDEEE